MLYRNVDNKVHNVVYDKILKLKYYNESSRTTTCERRTDQIKFTR